MGTFGRRTLYNPIVEEVRGLRTVVRGTRYRFSFHRPVGRVHPVGIAEVGLTRHWVITVIGGSQCTRTRPGPALVEG